MVVTHWFVTSTPTFSLSTWPLSPFHPELFEKSRLAPLLDFILPQSPITAWFASSHHRTRVVANEQTPLMGFHSLQRLSAKCPLITTLPQSLCSARAVSHDLDGLLHFAPLRGFPRIPLLGFVPFRGLPALTGQFHRWNRRPLWPCRRTHPLSAGDQRSLSS